MLQGATALTATQPTLATIPGVGPARIVHLKTLGIETLEQLAAAKADQLTGMRGVGPERAAEMIRGAKSLLKKPRATTTRKPATRKPATRRTSRRAKAAPKAAPEVAPQVVAQEVAEPAQVEQVPTEITVIVEAPKAEKPKKSKKSKKSSKKSKGKKSKGKS